MKQSFYWLAVFLILLYGREWYEEITRYKSAELYTEVSLTDIAEQVKAIPLEAAAGTPLLHAGQVKQCGEHLFLVNDHILYRYNEHGSFICRITDPSVIRVADYLVDTTRNQLIVLGNSQDIHYYTFSGILIENQTYLPEYEEERLISIAWHQDRIWLAKETVTGYLADGSSLLEKVLVEYDPTFQKINQYPIGLADLGRFRVFPDCHYPLLSVAKDTGEFYFYDASHEPDYLLKDTLHIQQCRLLPGLMAEIKGVPVFPVRVGGRMCISTAHNGTTGDQGYFFCHDTETNRTWYSQNGIKDTIFQTGCIDRLQPLDMYNEKWYYTRSGMDLEEKFPEAAAAGNPVLFIVSLKA